MSVLGGAALIVGVQVAVIAGVFLMLAVIGALDERDSGRR